MWIFGIIRFANYRTSFRYDSTTSGEIILSNAILTDLRSWRSFGYSPYYFYTRAELRTFIADFSLGISEWREDELQVRQAKYRLIYFLNNVISVKLTAVKTEK